MVPAAAHSQQLYSCGARGEFLSWLCLTAVQLYSRRLLRLELDLYSLDEYALKIFSDHQHKKLEAKIFATLSSSPLVLPQPQR